jgi:16S rRNA (guanine527-N7)-methyltransferase
VTQEPRVSRETPGAVARRVIAKAAPELAPADLDKLVRLVERLCSTPVGVTAIRDPAEAATRHVVEALAGLPAVDAAPAGPLADVGSGGGLPGLVLAVVRPERSIHLIEATARKAAFIAAVATEIGVPVQVHAERSEDLARGALRDACACVVARALAPPPVAAELCLPLCLPGGRVVLWSRESANAELAFAAAELGGELVAPECAGVLLIAKRSATPARFPRRPGMAAKRPLRDPGTDRSRK